MPTRDNQYFYASPDDVKGNSLFLKDEEADHCSRVLRKTVGDEFYAVDGEGHEFVVTLVSIRKNEVECKILETQNVPRELKARITIAQAMLKADHMDWILEKATELGAFEFIPLRTERTIMEAKPSKIDRWRKITLSAMKQSRRSRWPRVHGVTDFKSLFKSPLSGQKMIFHESATEMLTVQELEKSLVQELPILLIIGPEGGFTDSEVEVAREASCDVRLLGSRRLRAETACIAAMSLFSILGSRESR